MAHTIETITAYYSERNIDPNPGRIARLAKAIELGASDAALEAIADAVRTSTTSTIVLPPHRFENRSRGRGWACKGRGKDVTWGERVNGGYEVGPGRWEVGGHDGFQRKGTETWDVRHVVVGDETWTIAS